MRFAPIPADVEAVASQVVGAAIEAHRTLGPGFLERIYQVALCLELDARGIPFERECAVSVTYRNVPITGQRIDLVVNRRVIVERKATARIEPMHEAKLISYLGTTGLRVGLLLNFNAATLRDGIKRIVV